MMTSLTFLVSLAEGEPSLPGEASPLGDTLVFYGAVTVVVGLIVFFLWWLHALKR